MRQILLFCIVTALYAWASPSLQWENRDKIQPGKTFGLQLIYPLQEISPDFEKLQVDTKNGFTLVKIDSTDQVMRPSMDDPFAMMAYMQGRGRGGYKARVYTLKFKAPKKTGQLELGEISWIIKGEKYLIAKNIPVEIRRSYDDDALTATLKPSKTTIYEGEQIYLTLNFHTYEHFAGGLQAIDMNLGNDFTVHHNELNNLDFQPVENAPRESQATAKFAWASPNKSGNLQIEPFKFKYIKRGEPKIVSENKSGSGFSMSFQSVKQGNVESEISSKPIKITVKPLPEEGKPDNFSGMVGNYSISANVDKTKLKVGEALALTLTIKGDGTPGTITDPKLPDFEDFRVVPPENQISSKVERQKLVTTKKTSIFLYPKKKGSFTIPAISYSWFNPSKSTYESASVGPWEIEVEKGDGPTAEAIFQPQTNDGTPAGGPPVVQKQEIESLGSDIRFIHPVKMEEGKQAPYKEIWFWVAFLAAIPAYFIVVFAIRNKRKRSKDTALTRRNQADKMLKNRFVKANDALSKGDAKALYAALENGLMDYLSDLTNQEFRGMTRSQMKQELKNRDVSDETITSIDSWLEKCAFARYAPVNPSAGEQAQMLKDVEKLCESLKI